MALGGIVPDFNPFQNALAAAQASNAYANSYDKRANTREFVKTQEERVKATDAKHKLETQTADMGREANKAVRDKKLHETAAVQGKETAIAQSKTQEKVADRTGKFEDVVNITDADSHARAVAKRIQSGEEPQQVYAELGETYDPNWIAAAQQRYSEGAGEFAARTLQQEELDSQEYRTRLETHTKLAVADAQLQAEMLKARSNAAQNNLIGLDESPLKSHEMFLRDTLNSQDGGWLGKDENKAVTDAHKAHGYFNAMWVNLAAKYQESVAAGNPNPDYDPRIRANDLYKQSILLATGKYPYSPPLDTSGTGREGKLESTDAERDFDEKFHIMVTQPDHVLHEIIKNNPELQNLTAPELREKLRQDMLTHGSRTDTTN